VIENRLKEILLRAKKQVFTGNIGNHLTAFKGVGLDFAEIKDYSFGDDVRSINWKSSAKGLGVHVNQFHEERELDIIVAFMNSGSINFGIKRLKQEVMGEVLAFLSYSSLKNNDNLTTLFFNSSLEKLFKPSKNLGLVEDTLRYALELNPIGQSFDINSFCHFINSNLRRKSLIFLIGDFYEDVDLSSISHKNEVYAFIVRDRFEENPKFGGELSLVDPTNLDEINLNLDKSSLKQYKKLMNEHDDSMYEHFLMHRIKYGKVYTDDDVFIKISHILKS